MKVYVCWENCEQIAKVFASKDAAQKWVDTEDQDGRVGCGFTELELIGDEMNKSKTARRIGELEAEIKGMKRYLTGQNQGIERLYQMIQLTDGVQSAIGKLMLDKKVFTQEELQKTFEDNMKAAIDKQTEEAKKAETIVNELNKKEPTTNE